MNTCTFGMKVTKDVLKVGIGLRQAFDGAQQINTVKSQTERSNYMLMLDLPNVFGSVSYIAIEPVPSEIL